MKTVSRAPSLLCLLLVAVTLICCNRAPRSEIPLPTSLRSIEAPRPEIAIGTAILREPFGNVVALHLRDGSVDKRVDDRFMATPDEWIVPIIGPSHCPAVFALDGSRLWVWSEGQWGWLDDTEARFAPFEKASAK
jgi:hypothetical protein